jgi:hypothetical protein
MVLLLKSTAAQIQKEFENVEYFQLIDFCLLDPRKTLKTWQTKNPSQISKTTIQEFFLTGGPKHKYYKECLLEACFDFT